MAAPALVALAPHLLTGTTEASALADLQGRVALAAGRHRTKLVRADQIRDSVAEGRLRAVSVRVEVESDWSGLVAFLRATVADPAVLRVRSIGIRGPEAPTRTAQVEVLTGEVEVMGWYLPASAMEREDAR